MGLLARLLMLGLLLIGLGVVHTLAHADAHDGVVGHPAAHLLDPTTVADPEPAAEADEPPHHTTTVAAADPDSLPEADCWASVPTGPWPFPPARCAAGTTPFAYVAPLTDGQRDHRMLTSPQALGVLRI
ncbi:hypothetical protein DI272_44020 [Streptomyces sp. Act143]|nr:hypothetical protein DI272_44020 [Streptomyces sp. Act143]